MNNINNKYLSKKKAALQEVGNQTMFTKMLLMYLINNKRKNRIYKKKQKANIFTCTVLCRNYLFLLFLWVLDILSKKYLKVLNGPKK